MKKRIAITGASSGIGAEVARRCAAAGHSLVLTARREKLLEQVASDCRTLGSAGVQIVVGDITSSSIAEQLAGRLREMSGEPVLINNAGFANMQPFDEAEWASHEAQIEVNLTGAIQATYHLLPVILEQGSGLVVNVLSVAASHTFPAAAVYSATKAGLMKFGQCLLGEYRARGLRLTNILPGSVDTPLWEDQGWSPPKDQMLTSNMVADAILDVIHLPKDRVMERIDIAPPLGIL